ncbi:hypothetical protein [Haloferax sp. DFSO52]|uniref:hypothetical protein n=1 Tax=Haloferax sp. DFSO52 TaxID=3388505 RepID=UPI003A880C07
MEPEPFLQEFLEQESVIIDYKQAQKWSSPDLLFILYLLTAGLGFIINLFIKSSTNLGTTYFGVDDFFLYLILGAGVILGTVIMVASVDKLNSIGFRQRDVIYHYLAKSIDGFNESPERDYQKVISSLESAVEYADNQDIDFAHPRIEHSLREYISQINRYDSDAQKNRLVDESFEKIIGQVSNSILADESTDFEIEIDDSLVPKDNKSSPRFILRLLSDFFTEKRVQLLIPIVILLVALATFPIFGPQITIVVLGAYPIVNSLLQWRSGQRTDGS